MRKFLFFFLFCVGFLMPKVSEAQSSYYYLTGDTIMGRSPIYFYQWWSEQWLADTSHRLSLTRVIWDGWPGNGCIPRHIPHGEILQYCYTDTPIKIIGIATAAVTTGHSGSEELNLEPGYQEYLRLYEATTDTFALLKEVPFDRFKEKRYMKVDFRNTFGTFDWGTKCCHYPTPDTTRYVGIKEHYFEKPVTVTDSFYVGITTEGQYGSWPEDDPEGYFHTTDVVVNGLSIYWDSLLIQWRTALEGNYCNDFCESTPYTLHKYRHIWYEIGSNDTVDGSWHWWNSPYFMLEFPIVVIDSSYIIPPYECPPVQNVRLAQQGDGEAYVMWDTHGDHNSWQVSYGPATTDPDSGTVVNCPIQVGRIQGLDSCTHYWAYVRAVCDHDSICYSRWSDPVEIYFCDTTGGGGGGDDPQSIVTALDVMTYIVPNPAAAEVTVYSSFYINHIEAHSLQGVKTMDIPASGISASFDVKDWPSGVYVITIHTQGGNVTKKLVVQ
jgi:hypothetical protein